MAQQKVEMYSLKRSQHLIDQAEKGMSLALKAARVPIHTKGFLSFISTVNVLQICTSFSSLQVRSSNKLAQSDLTVEEMKVMMSLCTILNARCNRFKGLTIIYHSCS